jgi:hypothetical protein
LLIQGIGDVDESVIDNLTFIVGMHAEAGYDALVNYLEQRAKETAYSRWRELVGERGEFADVSAPPRVKAYLDSGTLATQLLEDFQSALRAHASFLPCAPLAPSQPLLSILLIIASFLTLITYPPR